jgi:hypothetical protein
MKGWEVNNANVTKRSLKCEGQIMARMLALSGAAVANAKSAAASGERMALAYER